MKAGSGIDGEDEAGRSKGIEAAGFARGAPDVGDEGFEGGEIRVSGFEEGDLVRGEFENGGDEGFRV